MVRPLSKMVGIDQSKTRIQQQEIAKLSLRLRLIQLIPNLLLDFFRFLSTTQHDPPFTTLESTRNVPGRSNELDVAEVGEPCSEESERFVCFVETDRE